MAALPYVTAPGNVTKALNAIASAATPAKVTQDFVKEMLKIPGGSGDQMTSFLKKIGMAGPDGTPTDTYKKFRNEATRGTAAAAVLQHGYAPLYGRNEYMHTLSETKLRGADHRGDGCRRNQCNRQKHGKVYSSDQWICET